MAKIILIYPNNEMRNIISFNLELYLGSDVILKDCFIDAKNFIEVLNEEIDLVITISHIQEEKSAMEIYRFLKSRDSNSPILVLGHDELLDNYVEFVKGDLNWKDIIKKAAKILGITASDMALKDVPDYFPININYFLQMDVAECDIYIRIAKDKGNKGTQFIKKFHVKEEVHRPDIEKYIKHGVNELYVLKEQRLKLVNNYSSKITQKLRQKDISKEERLAITAEGYAVVQDIIKNLGLTEDVIEIASESIKSMKKTVKDIPIFTDLLKELEKHSGNYLYNHSMCICFLGTYILDQMNLGTRERKEVFTFVAYFHDVLLHTEVQAKVNSVEDLKLANVGSSEKKFIEVHALECAKLLRDYPEVPLEAPMIIQQHHGHIDGTGFTELQSHRLKPLSCVFKVVEDLVDQILKATPKGEIDLAQIKQNLNKKYNKGYFEKTMIAVNALDHLQNVKTS